MISKIVQTVDFIKLKSKAKSLVKDIALELMTEDPAEVLKERIRKGVNYNNQKLAPLKRSTLNIRKMRGNKSAKPLIDTGRLLKSIKSKETKNKIGVEFLKYGIDQAEGFTTKNHFAVKKGSKIVGWRDYSEGRTIMPRPWIHPQEPFAGLLGGKPEAVKRRVIRAIKKAMKGKVIHFVGLSNKGKSQ